MNGVMGRVDRRKGVGGGEGEELKGMVEVNSVRRFVFRASSDRLQDGNEGG